jgi:hypothetical protein
MIQRQKAVHEKREFARLRQEAWQHPMTGKNGQPQLASSLTVRLANGVAYGLSLNR